MTVRIEQRGQRRLAECARERGRYETQFRRRSRTDAMLALTLTDFGIVRYEAAFC